MKICLVQFAYQPKLRVDETVTVVQKLYSHLDSNVYTVRITFFGSLNAPNTIQLLLQKNLLEK